MAGLGKTLFRQVFDLRFGAGLVLALAVHGGRFILILRVASTQPAVNPRQVHQLLIRRRDHIFVGDVKDLHQRLHPFGGELHFIVQDILLAVQDAVLEGLCKNHFHGIWKCHLGAIGIRVILPQPRLHIHLETRAALP